MKYSSVRDLRWANLEKNLVNCIVNFDHLKIEVPFTASPNDTEAHGREIYHRCISGDFGIIQDYLPSPGIVPREDDNTEGQTWLENWPEIHDFLVQANAENARGTPRGIILVWASMVELLLGRLLEAFLVDHSISKSIIWDDAHSSLGTFSGRSKCCFALGLITREDLSICDHIRTIRNAAAHDWNLDLSNVSFSKKAIPALQALYNTDHADLYNWCNDDLKFMIVHFYSSSCASLALRLVESRSSVHQEQRIVLKRASHSK